MENSRLEHIRGALASAENSIKLAKQLLAEMEGGIPERPSHHQPAPAPAVTTERPGVVGVYDGEKMTTAQGETYIIPGNYASKSLLVVGDTLKMYEENGDKRFKQIEHVKRHKTTGLLLKKDGKFRAITPEGSYKVLIESINHFNGEVGDEVILHLPAGNLTSPYAAIETIHKKNGPKTEKVELSTESLPTQVTAPKVETKTVEETPKPKKEAPKPPKPVEKKVLAPKPLPVVATKKIEEKVPEPVAEAPKLEETTPEVVSAADEELS